MSKTRCFAGSRHLFDAKRSFFVGLLTILFVGLPARAQSQALDGRVVEAALATYVHGMTAEIAHAEVGAAGIPTLLRLMADPSFPRRDNVVAFLAYVGDDATVDGLLALLRKPPGSTAIPEERRSLLLVPEALGRIAARNPGRAVESLLSMTEHDSGGGILASAAARSAAPTILRDDLLENAVHGLHLSGDANAAGRIDDIADGRVVPARGGRSLREFASRLRFSPVRPGGARARGGAAAVLDGAFVSVVAETAVAAATDTVANAHDSRLDFANHAATASPITAARVDQALAEASLRVGRADFGADVACCVGYSRKGIQKTFGSAGDGRDKIDNETELNAVLNDPSGRMKVVNQINWCGSSGTNIIGCGWIGGFGTAVVRLSSSLGQEAALWIHEYGHNVGLNHNNTSLDYVMWPMLGQGATNNRAVNATECSRYHQPASGAAADLAIEGACADTDADAVHDVQDNCPTIANTTQADGDGDGLGDVCESTCGNGQIDAGEACDGTNLGGQTCQSRGFGGGTLRCTSTCQLDVSACFRCGDGVIQAGEECDGGNLGGATCGDVSCTIGSARCSSSCTLDYATCGGCPQCDHDSVCELGEDCTGCPSDCPTGIGAACGDGVCQPAHGEDCLSCPQDCAGKQSGTRMGRFCCGDGAGTRPVGCADSRCTADALECDPAPAMPACCGDGDCSGAESSQVCSLDCGAPPSCGDGVCSAGESACSCPADCPAVAEACGDGVDNDCDGQTDCADSSCAGLAACSCKAPGGTCSSDAECCSFVCRAFTKTCR